MNPIQTSSRPILLPEPLDTHYRQSDAERLPPQTPGAGCITPDATGNPEQQTNQDPVPMNYPHLSPPNAQTHHPS